MTIKNLQLFKKLLKKIHQSLDTMCSWVLGCETALEVVLPFGTIVKKLPWNGLQMDPF